MNFTTDHQQQYPGQPTTGNKDKTGRRMSRTLLLMVCGKVQCLLHDGEKHLNFVEDGRNECWLKLIKRAQTKISQ